MSVDLTAAMDFMTMHARLLDRHRFGLLDGTSRPAAALAALAGYGNPDGGYGWGLEPDLRTPESQPAASMHAFEVFDEAEVTGDPRAVELCDWLAGVASEGGALPFALPASVRAGTSPWWLDPDGSPSLQITACVASAANRVAARHAGVAGHPWLQQATDWCLQRSLTLAENPQAIELGFALQLLDAVGPDRPGAAEALAALAGHLPPDGRLHVQGGTEDEFIAPLDFSPRPGVPTRTLLAPDVIDRALDELEAGQQEDGGWRVEFAHASAASALEWRGYATVRAVDTLRRNGRLD